MLEDVSSSVHQIAFSISILGSFFLAMMCPCAGFVLYVEKNPPELSEKQMSEQ